MVFQDETIDAAARVPLGLRHHEVNQRIERRTSVARSAGQRLGVDDADDGLRHAEQLANRVRLHHRHATTRTHRVQSTATRTAS